MPTKKTTTKTPPTHKEDSLVKGGILENIQWEAFCQAYGNNMETFGNGALSYAAAYGYSIEGPESEAYNTCKSNAYKLLTNTYIKDRIDTLRIALLNDKSVDSKLSGILYSAKDETSLNAIKEYNKLKQRITDKIEQRTTIELDSINLKRIEKAQELLRNVENSVGLE